MHVLIAAAGSGRRMGADRNKVLLPLAGRPVLGWTLRAVASAGGLRWLGVVGQPSDRDAIERCLGEADLPCPAVVVTGGDTRQESVRRGLEALPAEARSVLIHDAARCLVEPGLLERCQVEVDAGRAVVAATPVTDTIKQVDGDGTVVQTPDRERLWAAQTPQGFPLDRLREAHAIASREGWSVTDDAALFERLGWPVRVMASPRSNIKLTTPDDLCIAEALLRRRDDAGDPPETGAPLTPAG
ncbi:2-C-methyl-D-erythritol 4-phosphate cytidylyltransferase [Synechococcus sp. RSCCF101]|uniref:2-C-methyl-D-erythritol 4-phosphate cytidylyltransferase n=1 Tax=Synechococcus sp. RSCCF101 TaxID=2511069 RepID=UPI001246D1D7|nr:2-C-methyl-D-erythritol 4-phosphate cytidylyltransferase [Synechococcus sp. RSCCF101]QEY33257.1 2-C-methyl-D-erythritol 4-phosphate cytidylyltransferase [Synechococcus sp. RSCCF101]